MTNTTASKAPRTITLDGEEWKVTGWLTYREPTLLGFTHFATVARRHYGPAYAVRLVIEAGAVVRHEGPARL